DQFLAVTVEHDQPRQAAAAPRLELVVDLLAVRPAVGVDDQVDVVLGHAFCHLGSREELLEPQFAGRRHATAAASPGYPCPRDHALTRPAVRRAAVVRRLAVGRYCRGAGTTATRCP